MGTQPVLDVGRTGAEESRRVTDALLAQRHTDGWGLRSWGRFATSSFTRSLDQARHHPRAIGELTALHAAVAVLAGPQRRRWVATSWVMTVTHLGLLGSRRSIGAATAVTLVRANLPAVAGDWPWLGVAAICSDKADGMLARRAGPTHFGHYADSLADASFWAWFAVRHETDRRLLTTAAVAWVAPVAAVTIASFARGAMVDAPRSALVRPAAAMQVVVAVRVLRAGGRRSRPEVTGVPRP